MSGRTKLLASVGIGLLVLVLIEIALFATMSPPRAIFVQVATLGLLTALGTVTSRNLVHAALYLVGFFFLVACLFVLLEAEFMAAMQVLIYIGAVSILMLFGIMLTRNVQGDEAPAGYWTRKVPAAVVALALLGLLLHGTRSAQSLPGSAATPARPAWSTVDRRPPLVEGTPRISAVNDMARVLGHELMIRWVVPFEIAGLLLTAALVGAIALAMSEEPVDPLRRGAVATLQPGATLGPAFMAPGPADGEAAPARELREAAVSTTTASGSPH